MQAGACWNAAPGELAEALLRRGLGPPTAPLAAPQAEEAEEALDSLLFLYN